MTRRTILSSAVLTMALLQFAGPATAADISGKWMGTMQTPDGQSLEITFNFKMSGEKLTGTVASSYGEGEITEGSVKDDAVAFILMAGGGQFKITYKGKLVGDELKFNVTLGDMGDREMTAKRAQ
ncbi:MAG TPA: hypothetical protein VMH81_19680 [Bryobacteraceae bacterium]|nr:hypothetical protein [Bryobacteraceae bacterium]